MRPLLVTLAFLGLQLYPAFAQENPSILIAYYSQSGSTQALAESIAEGAKAVEGVRVILLPIDQVKALDLIQSSAIIVGSPVYNANIAPPVQEFINSWPFEGRPLKNKLGAAFATGGGISIGEEQVMLGILQAMLIHGMIVVGGEDTEAAFGASAVTGEGPFKTGQVEEIFLEKGLELGKRVASLVQKMTWD
jgi:NAD(P)H dehydrogenase (quinone)